MYLISQIKDKDLVKKQNNFVFFLLWFILVI